jgi:hypothetical protein
MCIKSLIAIRGGCRTESNMAGQVFRKLYGHFEHCMEERWNLPVPSPSREQKERFICGEREAVARGISQPGIGSCILCPPQLSQEVNCQFIPHEPGNHWIHDEE